MIAPSSRVATAFCIALALASCSTLPASAPTASQIESPGEQGYVGDYLFVRLTPGVAGLMGVMNMEASPTRSASAATSRAMRYARAM